MNWIDDLKMLLFPPVSRREALAIARKALSCSMAEAALVCHGRVPKHFRVYGSFSEPCWWIVAPWGNNGKNGLVIRSSRVIAVGRKTGKVHYDGSAGDEG